jgi:hypothetical protein
LTKKVLRTGLVRWAIISRLDEVRQVVTRLAAVAVEVAVAGVAPGTATLLCFAQINLE